MNISVGSDSVHFHFSIDWQPQTKICARRNETNAFKKKKKMRTRRAKIDVECWRYAARCIKIAMHIIYNTESEQTNRNTPRTAAEKHVFGDSRHVDGIPTQIDGGRVPI